MKEYKMNFATKTLTITKAFAEAALDPESEASTIIANCRAVCPDLRIAYRTHKSSKTSNPAKGMTYDRMERYISAFADGADALAEFEKVKEFFEPCGFIIKGSKSAPFYLLFRTDAIIKAIRAANTPAYAVPNVPI